MSTQYGLATNLVLDTSSPLNSVNPFESIQIDYRAPEDMEEYHWHGQVEVNIPYGGSVTYLINQQEVTLESGHVGIFWATTPHKLTSISGSPLMGIIYIPLHLFLSWPINKDLSNQIIHGAKLQSRESNLVSQFEVERWHSEIQLSDDARKQLIIEEISIFIRRLGLLGWNTVLPPSKVNLLAQRTTLGVSKQAKHHVQQMLTYIAQHHHQSIKLKDLADHVQLHQNYAINLFQKVMQMSIKEYITHMRIQHAKALLIDTERTMLDIALTVGFQSTSRFYASFKQLMQTTPSAYRHLHK